MPGVRYRLTYFPAKGRAELIRLVFHAARVPFEDRRLSYAEWLQLKPKIPTGSLPILEMNGEVFPESAAIVDWAARKFGLMGKTDAEELKAQAIVIQATELREMYFIPVMMEKDPEKQEVLKEKLQSQADKVFRLWEGQVVQTESTGRKVFSYMVTQSMTAADLAVLYVSDMAEEHIQVDWGSFPRLQGVLRTVSELPHLRTYLDTWQQQQQEQTASNSKAQVTSNTPQPNTPRTPRTPCNHTPSPK